ncbi:MAG: hypothetical protein KAJ75_05370 [Alphaproteobacteria bacterium]|nr:hypothetical protein [Alphaproteobacteria bacterium]
MLDVALIIFIVLLLATAFSFILAPFAGSPPIPSTPKTCQAMIDAIHKYDPDGEVIIEVGFAWAGLSIKLAKTFPNRKIIAYEISPFPYLMGRIRKCFSRNVGNLTLCYGNAFKAFEKGSLKPDTIVFYLCDSISEKAKVCMPAAKNLVLANTYAVPDTEPSEVINVGDIANSKLYCYNTSLLEVKK